MANRARRTAPTIDTVVSGVKEHAEQPDGEIAAKSGLRGTLARLSRVDLAIMRLAVYKEMQYRGTAGGGGDQRGG
ncbi:MAG: hypothetical protein ACLUI3_15490 [Christensenellales bacterium]